MSGEAPVVGGKILTPVHYSPENGVHADWGTGADKAHIPYEGQTNLSVFRVGGRPSYESDAQLAALGGVLRADKAR